MNKCCCQKHNNDALTCLTLCKAGEFVSADLKEPAPNCGLPVVVFVNSYEIDRDCAITPLVLTDAQVTDTLGWSDRVYDDEDDYVEQFVEEAWHEGLDKAKLEEHARSHWRENCSKAVVCQARNAATPTKRC